MFPATLISARHLASSEIAAAAYAAATAPKEEEALRRLLVGKNVTDVARDMVDIPVRRVRHIDLVEIVQALRGEDV